MQASRETFTSSKYPDSVRQSQPSCEWPYPQRYADTEDDEYIPISTRDDVYGQDAGPSRSFPLGQQMPKQTDPLPAHTFEGTNTATVELKIKTRNWNFSCRSSESTLQAVFANVPVLQKHLSPDSKY